MRKLVVGLLSLACLAGLASAAPPTTLPAIDIAAGERIQDADAADRLLEFALIQNRQARERLDRYSYDFVIEHVVAGQDRPRLRVVGTFVRTPDGTYSEHHSEPVYVPPGEPGPRPVWYRSVETAEIAAVNKEGENGYVFHRLLDGAKSAEAKFWLETGQVKDAVRRVALGGHMPLNSVQDRFNVVRSNDAGRYLVYEYDVGGENDGVSGRGVLFETEYPEVGSSQRTVLSTDGTGRVLVNEGNWNPTTPNVRERCDYARLPGGELFLRTFRRDYFSEEQPGVLKYQETTTLSNIRIGGDVSDDLISLRSVSPDKPLAVTVHRPDETTEEGVLNDGVLVPLKVWQALQTSKPATVGGGEPKSAQ